MEDDNDTFWDDDDDGYDTLLELELEQGASAARSATAAAAAPQSHRATSDERRRRTNPTQWLRPALSFSGDTSFQQLDPGVLDEKGDGLDSVDDQQQNALLGTPGETPGGDGGGGGDDGSQRIYTTTSLGPGQWRRITADEPGVAVEPLITHAKTPYGVSAIESMQVEELKEQIDQLNRERERLAQDLAAATAVDEARAGEIAIIRANQAKVEKNHSRQIGALQSAMDEEIKKYRAEVEAAMMESKRLVAENGFLRHDLQEEARRTARLQKQQQQQQQQQAARGRSKAAEHAPTTPRKSKPLPLRDGFEDDELMASPTKSRSRRGTPATSNKRKRAVDDSPIPLALQLREPDEEEHAKNAEQQGRPKEDRNMRFMRRILNHRTYPRDAPDLEVFASMALPSDPDVKFSSIILQSVTAHSSPNYAIDYTRAVAALWARSLKEHFHPPVGQFMAIVKFVLHMDLHALAPPLVDSLVPVLQTSGYVNGIPRFTSSPVSHENLGKIKRTPQKMLDHRVSSTEALELLYLIAGGCQHSREATERFWRCVGYQFVLIMLNSYQQLNDIILTLKMLACGQLATTFGPISDSESQQLEHEKYIIDRAANLLSEIPSADEGEEAYSPWEIGTLRLEVMSFLSEIAFASPDAENNRIGRMIASHPSALARIFRSLHDELDALYAHPAERDLHAAMVNGLTRLVYGIVKLFPTLIDLPSRLRAVPGAVQKHLVVLTRLAFSEGMVLEAGILDETVEMAHEMLEDAVNPQEAEALLEAFRSTGESTKS